MNIDDAIRSVDGFLGEAEARHLHALAADVQPPNVILEVGGYKGRSTCALAIGAKVPVYSVDTHAKDAGGDFPYSDEDRACWTENVLKMGVATRVRPINLPSVDVAEIFQESIGLLFIDGCHALDSVRQDLACWIPHVAPNGLVAMHDNYAPGVVQAVIEYIADFNDLQIVSIVESTSVYRIVKR